MGKVGGGGVGGVESMARVDGVESMGTVGREKMGG